MQCKRKGCIEPSYMGKSKCKRHLLAHNEACKRYDAKRRQPRQCTRVNGNLYNCQKPAARGKEMCKECITTIRDTQKRKRECKKSLGICIVGGCHSPAMVDRIKCERHVLRYRKENKQYYQRKSNGY